MAGCCWSRSARCSASGSAGRAATEDAPRRGGPMLPIMDRDRRPGPAELRLLKCHASAARDAPGVVTRDGARRTTWEGFMGMRPRLAKAAAVAIVAGACALLPSPGARAET